MFIRLMVLFLVVPIVEIYLLLKVGAVIGGFATVLLLFFISLVGAYLIRSQGFLILKRIREELAAGQLPAASLIDGALVLVGGVLLLTPGFFTDFLGIFFLFPATRSVIKRRLGLWLASRLERGGLALRRR